MYSEFWFKKLLPNNLNQNLFKYRLSNNIMANPRPSILLVDPEYAPMLGHAIRAAHLLGVENFYLSDANNLYTGDQQSTLEKFSAGAVNEQEIISVGNPLRFLRANPEQSRRIAATLADNALNLYDFAFNSDRPDLLVFGPERAGLPRDIVQACDLGVMIPQNPSHAQCHTLASAVSIFLSEAARQAHIRGKAD